MTLEENRNPFSLVPQSTREVDPFISAPETQSDRKTGVLPPPPGTPPPYEGDSLFVDRYRQEADPVRQGAGV